MMGEFKLHIRPRLGRSLGGALDGLFVMANHAAERRQSVVGSKPSCTAYNGVNGMTLPSAPHNLSLVQTQRHETKSTQASIKNDQTLSTGAPLEQATQHRNSSRKTIASALRHDQDLPPPQTRPQETKSTQVSTSNNLAASVPKLLPAEARTEAPQISASSSSPVKGAKSAPSMAIPVSQRDTLVLALQEAASRQGLQSVDFNPAATSSALGSQPMLETRPSVNGGNAAIQPMPCHHEQTQFARTGAANNRGVTDTLSGVAALMDRDDFAQAIPNLSDHQPMYVSARPNKKSEQFLPLSPVMDQLLPFDTRQSANSEYKARNIPDQADIAEDDFDYEVRLREALGQILASDMLRHGLRLPGVF